MKKGLLIITVLMVVLVSSGCRGTSAEEGAAKEDSAALQEYSTTEENYSEEIIEVSGTIIEKNDFKGAITSISPEKFEAAGFELGDSCNFSFGNGYTAENVPFYNGYYAKTGDPLIVAYPGDGSLLITCSNTGIWEIAELEAGEEFTITLNEKGGYADIQDTLGQQYSFDRDDYTSDEEFCNYRELDGGNLKADKFYRGASPVDNSRCRAVYTDALIEKEGIEFEMNLADSDEEVQKFMAQDDFDSPYFTNLYENGCVALLNMTNDYEGEVFKKLVVNGFRDMMNYDGKVYIHCLEGKDRTGFVCMILEALAGATYDEMCADYMTTYKNYYKVTEEKKPEKYQAIKELYFDSFCQFILGTDDMEAIKNADYSKAAAAYLMEGGMTEKEVLAFVEYISAGDNPLLCR